MKTNYKAIILSLMTLLGSYSVQAVESLYLTDKIRSQNGFGDIDILKDVSSATLESLRVNNGSKLKFGVDVNENNSGIETPNSQGVAIERMTLTIKLPNKNLVYQVQGPIGPEVADPSKLCCKTPYISLLAKNPATVRGRYFTLIGDAGSSRLTPANKIQETIDSVITFEVPESVANATEAKLSIQLLDTNVNLGDAENYYDYNGGFEDVALLTDSDADYIENLKPGREEAPLVIPSESTQTVPPESVNSWTYTPGSNDFYMAAYEDNYPVQGDYDFNDLVVAYQIGRGLNAEGQLVRIKVRAYLVARGAAYSHDWHLGLSLPANVSGQLNCALTRNAETGPQSCSNRNPATIQGAADIVVFENTVALFNDPGSNTAFVNTVEGRPFLPGPKAEIVIELDNPIDPSQLCSGTCDPWLYVRNTNRAIKLKEVDPTFTDEEGYPFGMLVPTGWKHPLEHHSLMAAYPRFFDFVATQGVESSGWYSQSESADVYPLPQKSLYAW